MSVGRPIFVVGDGRSGTTLVRSSLSAHPRISIAPETHLLRKAAASGHLAAGTHPDPEGFWRSYRSSIYFRDLGVDPGRCEALAGPDPTFAALFDALLSAYKERTGAARVGEKTPGHVDHLDRLLDWYPDARVVVLQRDPRAVVASKLRAPWIQRTTTEPSWRHGVVVDGRTQKLLSQAGNWARTYERVVPRWSSHPSVHTVVYERLVADPEGVVSELCRFVGEPFDPAMIAGRSDDTVAAPAGRAGDDGRQAWRRDHHARSLAPVSTDSLHRWRRELSRLEVALVERRCRRGMALLGYQPTATAPERVLALAAGRAVGAAARAETAVRSRLR